MSRKLLYINGLAIISVVLYHSSAWGFISMFWWAHRYRPVGETNFDQLRNTEYYGLRLIEQLVIFAIPAFIFVSGYFIAVAAGRNKTLGWGVVFNRIKFLAIPFVIWSVVSLLFKMIQGERYTPINFLQLIITGRSVDPFYFIILLVQLYLISPILVYQIRKGWKPVLVVTAVIQLMVLFLRYAAILQPDLRLSSVLSEGILFTSYIFWFALGIVIGLYLSQIKNILAKYRYWFLVGALLFIILGVTEWEMLFLLSGREWIGPEETLIDQIYALFLILSFLAFEKIQLPWHEQITTLGTRSYAIYLVHTLVLIAASKFIYHVAPVVMEYQILFQSILVFLGLGIPLLLTYAVERSNFRQYYKYVFG